MPDPGVQCVRVEGSPSRRSLIAQRENLCTRVGGKGGRRGAGACNCTALSVALCDGPRKVGTLSRERGPVGSPDLSVFGERAIYVPIVPIVVPVPVPRVPSARARGASASARCAKLRASASFHL